MGRSLRVQKFVPGRERRKLDMTRHQAFGEGYTEAYVCRSGQVTVKSDAPCHVAQILLQKRH